MECIKCGNNVVISRKAYLNLEFYNVGGSTIINWGEK